MNARMHVFFLCMYVCHHIYIIDLSFHILYACMHMCIYESMYVWNYVCMVL